MTTKFLIAFLLLSYSLVAQSAIPTKEWQVKTAVLGLEEDFRNGAKVYGYDANGDFAVLREGTNQYFCLADDPKKDGFQVAAYHKDLESFMARGRELKKQGKNFKEIFDIREEEVKSGSLKMPYGSTLIVLKGDVNDTSKDIENEKVRYVVLYPICHYRNYRLTNKTTSRWTCMDYEPGDTQSSYNDYTNVSEKRGGLKGGNYKNTGLLIF